MHRMYLTVITVAALALSATAQLSTVTITSVKDNTLYQSILGDLTNGGGSYMFAGLTGSGGAPPVRRGLVQFDVAGSVPAGAFIVGATLTCTVDNPNGGGGSATLTVHPALADWGEGTVVASSGQGGGGAAQAGDATWLHRHFPGVFWDAPGGDFGGASASVVTSVNGAFSWPSTAQTIGDVQSWLDDPCHNFGWVIDGNGGPAKRLGTRENATAADRPSLEIVYLATPVTTKFPGNSPDLSIDVSLNGCASGGGSGVHNVVTALNDIVTLNFNSPGDTYTGQGFFAAVQPFVTGMTTGDAGGPAPLVLGGGTAVHLDLTNTGSIIVLVNSLGATGLFNHVITPFSDASFLVPAPFAGLSLVVSCLITDFGIPGDFIAVPDAQELVIL